VPHVAVADASLYCDFSTQVSAGAWRQGCPSRRAWRDTRPDLEDSVPWLRFSTGWAGWHSGGAGTSCWCGRPCSAPSASRRPLHPDCLMRPGRRPASRRRWDGPWSSRYYNCS